MPRYKLRTLLIVLAIGPPMLAGCFGSREPTFVARSDARIRDLMLGNTPPGTSADKVMLFVVNVSYDKGDAYSKWVESYSASTGLVPDLTPTDDRTISVTTRMRPTDKKEENVRAIWHFDDNDCVIDVTIERFAAAP